MVRAPEHLTTRRLTLRMPALEDAEAVFSRIGSDPEVTRYVSWARHPSVEHTSQIIAKGLDVWKKDGVGPYLIFDDPSSLLGSTGLYLGSDGVADTGYVLAQDAWGRGLATEALSTMVDLATQLDLTEVTACVHPDNLPSIRVLEKVGFSLRGQCRPAPFPNLHGGVETPVLDYARVLRDSGA